MKKREISILILSLFMALVASLINQSISQIKNVTIDDEGKVIVIETNKNTVSEVLEEQGIHIGEDDDVTPALKAKLERKQTIIVSRAKPITVLAYGQEISTMTCKANVKGVFEQLNISLNLEDEVSVSLEETVVPNMKIEITSVSKNIDTVVEKLPYSLIKRPSGKLQKGQVKVLQKGREGEVRKQFEVVMHNNKEAFKTLINEEILSKPIDQIEEHGTIGVYKTSRGEPFRFKKVLNMRATAYDLSYESCGKYPDHPQYGITRSGMKARYGVVAVDPKVIPLLSRLYIEAADGSWVYGHAIAGDTGGAVKGNIIDLFYDDVNFVNRFGIKPVKVYVLE